VCYKLYRIYFEISFLLFITMNTSGQTASKLHAADTVKYTIDNCVNTFSTDKTIKTSAGYQYWFVDKNFLDGRTIKLSVVKPHDATHAPHSHPEDEFFFILEGKAEFYLDGHTRFVGPMTSLYCPSYIEHGIRNSGDTELKYLVIKKYIMNK
jgi:mannose-6-phosphate isomerase-like protein (cupin superfamily)